MSDLFPPGETPPFAAYKALSLTQPWATLMALGVKRIETRSWKTNFRGWLAIHASKGFPRDCRQLCLEDPFASALIKAGFNDPAELPTGQVIAAVYLHDCVPTSEAARNLVRCGTVEDENELHFGDYGDGRYAWLTRDVKRIRTFAVNGSLSVWELPRPLLPDDIVP